MCFLLVKCMQPAAMGAQKCVMLMFQMFFFAPRFLTKFPKFSEESQKTFLRRFRRIGGGGYAGQLLFFPEGETPPPPSNRSPPGPLFGSSVKFSGVGLVFGGGAFI